MLTFVGLGLYNERSITVEGRDVLRQTDRVFAERYTSRLVGASFEDIESSHGIEIEVRDRAGVEGNPEPMLKAAEGEAVAFLTAGDTMISTTHVDLRLRAHDRGIDTRIVHGTTAQTAASSLTGLQNYRFGKATTLPFEYAHGGEGVPESVCETIDDNADRGLHTLVYLDIKVDGPDRPGDTPAEPYMSASTAADYLSEHYPDRLGVVVARAGSPNPTVEADNLPALADRSFGDPLHLLVVPGTLHPIEAEALVALANAPQSIIDT